MTSSRKPWKATSEPRAEARGQAPGSLRVKRSRVNKGNRDSLSFQFQDFREYGYDGANRLQKIKEHRSASLG